MVWKITALMVIMSAFFSSSSFTRAGDDIIDSPDRDFVANSDKIFTAAQHGIENDWIIILNEQEGDDENDILQTTAADFATLLSNHDEKHHNNENSKDLKTTSQQHHQRDQQKQRVEDLFRISRTYNSKAIKGYEVSMSSTDAIRLSLDPRVKLLEQNRAVFIPTTTTTNTITTTTASASTEIWGLDRIDQLDLPLDGKPFSPGYGENKGVGVTAYVLDTGIRTTHEDFTGRATWGTNTSGDEKNYDCNGHGTHVASTVGGHTYGVAKGVHLVAVKVLPCGDEPGSSAAILAGIEWVSQNAIKPAVVNMSLGSKNGISESINFAVRGLVRSGITVVVAAGNESLNACTRSPSSEETAITVASSNIDDERSDFSNFGTCVDLFAPGEDITAAWNTGDSNVKTISGTSMASPHVTGAVALILGSHSTLTPDEIMEELETKAPTGKITNVVGSPNLLLNVEDSIPTAIPTPVPVCDDSSLFMLQLTTDDYPKETSWQLINNCNNITEVEVEEKFYTKQGNLHKEQACLQDGQYTFIILDTQGDGICCNWGSGSYVVEFNGSEIASGGAFESAESTTFGVSCPGVPSGSPTTIPSSVPSNPVPSSTPSDPIPSSKPSSPIPSSFPSKSPTFLPSSQPSLNPSLSPTMEPSLKPSFEPSFSPTDKPSREPSISPSDKPSREPSSLPTLSLSPSSYPSRVPSPHPSSYPSREPSSNPTPQPCSTFNLQLTTDNSPNETSWSLFNNCTNTLQLSGGSFMQKQHTHSVEECIPEAEYTFTIYDTSSNGICCNDGNGMYVLKFNGAEVYTGGSFETPSQSIGFGSCTKDTDYTQSPSSSPTIGALFLRTPVEPPTSSITVGRSCTLSYYFISLIIFYHLLS